jgi:putative endonuclease
MLHLQKKTVVLKYLETFEDIKQAIAWEKQLKGWSRKKKEALFVDDWDKIVELAKNRQNITINSSNLTGRPSTGSG